MRSTIHPKFGGSVTLTDRIFISVKMTDLQPFVERLKVYLEQTAPLIEYYCEQGLLKTIDGDQEIDDVTRALLAALPPTKEA